MQYCRRHALRDSARALLRQDGAAASRRTLASQLQMRFRGDEFP